MTKLHEAIDWEQKCSLKTALNDYESKIKEFAKRDVSDDFWEKELIVIQKLKKNLTMVGVLV